MPGCPPLELCCPLFGFGRRQQDETDVPTRVAKLQKSLFSTSLAQGMLATLDFALNDPVTGLISCAIATMGTQAAAVNGHKYLKSYMVLTFCNGSMQVLLGLEAIGSPFAAVAGRQLVV